MGNLCGSIGIAMSMKTLILAAGSGERFRALGIKTPKPLVRLCGLSLLERTIRTAAKAGSTEILVVIGCEADKIQSELESRLRALPVRWIRNSKWEAGNGTSMLAAAPYINNEPVLVLMSDHLVFASSLRGVWKAATASQKSTMAVDFKLGTVSDPDDATKVQVEKGLVSAIGKSLTDFNAYDTGISVCYPEYFEQLAQSSKVGTPCSHTDGMKCLVASHNLRAWDMGGDLWEDVDSPQAHKAAERILFRSLRKSTDGFMSQHLERHISGFITKLLMNTPVTPNQITILVMGVGAVAAYFFAQPFPILHVLGAFLFWCSSFLDGCDGEIARLKFQESKLGGWLDIWGDNVVHILVFTGMGIGLSRQWADPQWTRLGILASLGVLISVGWVSWGVLRKKGGEGPFFTSVAEKSDGLSRLADAMSRRDFIFGTMFIAAFGWLPYFLWAAAIGSHVYWMILVAISLRQRA